MPATATSGAHRRAAATSRMSDSAHASSHQHPHDHPSVAVSNHARDEHPAVTYLREANGQQRLDVGCHPDWHFVAATRLHSCLHSEEVAAASAVPEVHVAVDTSEDDAPGSNGHPGTAAGAATQLTTLEVEAMYHGMVTASMGLAGGHCCYAPDRLLSSTQRLAYAHEGHRCAIWVQ